MRRRTGAGPYARFLLMLMITASGGVFAQNQAAPPSGAAPAAEGQASNDDTQKVKLPNVNVQGKRNVFNDNDKRVKDLQESLPCTGCDAKPHTRKKLVKRVLDAVGDRVLPSEAPDRSDRDAGDRAREFSQERTCSAANLGGCVQDNLKP